MQQSQDEQREWALPVSQVVSYAVGNGCRYGFIITDDLFVALRIAKEPISQGLSSTRLRRASTA